MRTAQIDQMKVHFNRSHELIRERRFGEARSELDRIISGSPRPSLALIATYIQFQTAMAEDRWMLALEPLRFGRRFGVASDRFLSAVHEGMVLSLQAPGLGEAVYADFEGEAREAGRSDYQHMLIGRRVSDSQMFDANRSLR